MEELHEDLRKKVNDRSEELKGLVVHLLNSVYKEALDCGQMSINTESQYAAFKKRILDIGNDVARELAVILKDVLLVDKQITVRQDRFVFTKKEGVDNG